MHEAEKSSASSRFTFGKNICLIIVRYGRSTDCANPC